MADRKKIEKAVYGADLAHRENAQAKRIAERDKLAEARTARPWKRRKLLAELDKKIATEGYGIASDKEHVFANPMSEKLYRAEKKRLKAQEADKLKQTAIGHHPQPSASGVESNDVPKPVRKKFASIKAFLGEKKKSSTQENDLSIGRKPMSKDFGLADD